MLLLMQSNVLFRLCLVGKNCTRNLADSTALRTEM